MMSHKIHPYTVVNFPLCMKCCLTTKRQMDDKMTALYIKLLNMNVYNINNKADPSPVSLRVLDFFM